MNHVNVLRENLLYTDFRGKPTGRDEKSISQPGFEESVFVGFVEINVTGKNDLYVTRINEKDDEFWSNPKLDNLVKLERAFVDVTEDA